MQLWLGVAVAVLAVGSGEEMCMDRLRAVTHTLCTCQHNRLKRSTNPLFEKRAPLPLKRGMDEDDDDDAYRYLPIKRAPLPLKRAPLPLKRAPLPLKRAPLPLKRAPLPLKRAPLPLKRAPLPLKRAPLPLKRAPLPLKRAPLPLKRFVEDDDWAPSAQAAKAEYLAELCCEQRCSLAQIEDACCN